MACIRSRSVTLAALVGVTTFGLGALTGAPNPAGANQFPSGSNPFREVVFLSHVNTPGMPIYPGDAIPVYDTFADPFFQLQTVTIGDHTGTHWGAPCHFADPDGAMGDPDDLCAEGLDTDSFVMPVVVIDIRAKVQRAVAQGNDNYALTVGDVRAFERKHGRIPDGAMVVAYTGWQERWSDPVAYMGPSSADDYNAFLAGADAESYDFDAIFPLNYPGISAEATEWLVERRSIQGLGIDTHGIDPGNDEEFLSNTVLLQEGRVHLENLAGLDQMPARGGWIVIGGMRNQGGSGSPATIYGFIP